MKKYSVLNNVYYGNNATLNGSCKSGYTQVGGEIKYTCSNGGWSKSGSCNAGCATNSIPNGYWKNNANNANVSNTTLAHGTTVSMVCRDGYTLVGSSVANCNNGTWDFSSSNGGCIQVGGCHEYIIPGQYTFTVPTGVTQLEFDIKGGKGARKGGNGGQTTGKYNISTGTKLYIVVGGAGDNNDNSGYNGGGLSSLARGGGATHISKSAGLLNEITAWNNVLVVAGGGGGHEGGNGGGNNNSGKNGTYYPGNGGTQTEGGNLGGSKGQGGNNIDYKNGGGGGGYYGGGAGISTNSIYYGSGGGGSAFCGNGVFDCGGSDGSNTGDGYVKIKWGNTNSICEQN